MHEVHKLHPSIVREYDIRGVVGATLSETDAYYIGRAFGTVVRRAGGSSAAVGIDGRVSSAALGIALNTGLRDAGLNVLFIGVGPTPMLYFASHKHQTDGAIQVTGSHNPADHNGFKFVLRQKPFFGDDLKQLGELISLGNFESGAGILTDLPVEDEYVDRLLADFVPGVDLKVIWDSGNGASGRVLRKLLSKLPGQHELLFGEIDGTFPNHHPDPTDPRTLKHLQAAVLASEADIGVAFDGDGDRLGVVDGKGRILFGDQIMMILSESILAEQPGATIIADVKASQALFDLIARCGGRPLMWRTGHSLIKSKIVETGATLAGEMSGHIFFNDRYYGYDDALYAAIRFLSIISGWGKQALADKYDQLPQMACTPELRIPCADDDKIQIIRNMKEQLALDSAAFEDIDGVRVKHSSGSWWLVRASNTQAILVARAEAEDSSALGECLAEMAQYLSRSGMPHASAAIAEALRSTLNTH